MSEERADQDTLANVQAESLSTKETTKQAEPSSSHSNAPTSADTDGTVKKEAVPDKSVASPSTAEEKPKTVPEEPVGVPSTTEEKPGTSSQATKRGSTSRRRDSIFPTTPRKSIAAKVTNQSRKSVPDSIPHDHVLKATDKPGGIKSVIRRMSSFFKAPSPHNDVSRVTIIQEKLKEPFRNVGYSRSRQLLEELERLRGFNDLDSLLKIAECDLHLGDQQSAREMRRAMHPVRKHIATSTDLSFQDIQSMIVQTAKSECHVRALILLHILCDLYPVSSLSPDDAVKWIRDRVNEMTDVLEAQATTAGMRSRKIGIEIGLGKMEEMLKKLQAIEGVTSKTRALTESRCIVDISYIYNHMEEWDTVISLCNLGIKVLEKEFGEDANKYRNYELLLNSLGGANGRLGRFTVAQKYFSKTIEACKAATDYDSETQRRQSIDQSQSNLNFILRMLREQNERKLSY